MAPFDEAEFARWRGRIVWEATFKRSGGREVELKVDARTGTVIEIDRRRLTCAFLGDARGHRAPVTHIASGFVDTPLSDRSSATIGGEVLLSMVVDACLGEVHSAAPR